MELTGPPQRAGTKELGQEERVIGMIETLVIAGAGVAFVAACAIARSVLSHNRRLPA